MVKVALLLSVMILLIVAQSMNSTPLRRFTDYEADSEWEELFGHLSQNPSSSLSTRESTQVDVERENLLELEKAESSPTTSTTPKPSVPPIPPAAPFVFDPDNNKLPSVGTNTQGNMEGIAISQNRGISLGIYMVHSSYNNFHTIFGHSNITKSNQT